MTPDHFHPLSVHFPIVLILVGFLFDLIALFFRKDHCLSKAGFFLMILGTLGAVASFLTGEFFSKELIGPAGEVKETHQLMAKITMFVMIAASVIRIYAVIAKKDKGFFKWIVFALFLAGAAFVAYTGMLGGTLVYDYML